MDFAETLWLYFEEIQNISDKFKMLPIVAEKRTSTRIFGKFQEF